MSPVEWLASLCKPGSRTALCTVPFPLGFRGGQWGVSTNGQGMVAVAELSIPAVDFETKPAGEYLQAVSERELSVPWARVQTFIDVPVLDDCPACYQGKATCECCGQEHPCDLCGATGNVVPLLPGRVADDVIIDRSLLRRFLGQLTAETVLVRHSKAPDAVYFDGESWIVVIMPLRQPASEPVEVSL